MLSRVEHEQSFITSRSGQKSRRQFLMMSLNLSSTILSYKKTPSDMSLTLDRSSSNTESVD